MSVHQKTKSLSARGERLSDTFVQLSVLNGKEASELDIPMFSDQIKTSGFNGLKPVGADIFQLNIGKLCNQTCAHCHVDAGPDKKHEMMTRADLETCLHIIEKYNYKTVDITGGAPELHSEFKWFVESCRAMGKEVIDRCNLTVILSNKKYHDLPQWFAENKVKLISSLPYFSKVRTDSQRGDGVFEDSIMALQMLNAVGYGKPGTELTIDLVYNPSGAFLPGAQEGLEKEFKQQLLRRYGIEFNQLFAITNMPISRFLEYLLDSGNYETYMHELVNAYNPATVANVMCRNMISVSWDGHVYDCDFNQMLDLKVAGSSKHISTYDHDDIISRQIVLNQHCYGCTAGAGSSCGGEVL